MKRIARSTLQTPSILCSSPCSHSHTGLVFFMTHDAIVKSEEGEKLKLIKQIVPSALFDNDVIQDTLSIPPANCWH